MQQEMKYIYMVYQKGSFSKAAQALYMTQPALSIAVQRVENEIGMPIFRRDHQPLELTEAGRVYIAKIQEIQFLEYQLEQKGERPHNVEGYKSENWIVLDYSDVIVHIFNEETREFYKLEQLWADGEQVDVSGLVKE